MRMVYLTIITVFFQLTQSEYSMRILPSVTGQNSHRKLIFSVFFSWEFLHGWVRCGTGASISAKNASNIEASVERFFKATYVLHGRLWPVLCANQ